MEGSDIASLQGPQPLDDSDDGALHLAGDEEADGEAEHDGHEDCRHTNAGGRAGHVRGFRRLRSGAFTEQVRHVGQGSRGVAVFALHLGIAGRLVELAALANRRDGCRIAVHIRLVAGVELGQQFLRVRGAEVLEVRLQEGALFGHRLRIGVERGRVLVVRGLIGAAQQDVFQLLVLRLEGRAELGGVEGRVVGRTDHVLEPVIRLAGAVQHEACGSATDREHQEEAGNELRLDAQVSEHRHGVRRAPEELQG